MKTFDAAKRLRSFLASLRTLASTTAGTGRALPSEAPRPTEYEDAAPAAGLLRQAAREEDAYSLLEIMIVIVIIGILALIAVPKFTGVTVKAKMTEAKTMLKQVHTLQTAYHYERDVYAKELGAIGFEQAPLVTEGEGGSARYRISIEEASPQGFTALATAVVDYDGDGQMNVWEVGPEGRITERTPD